MTTRGTMLEVIPLTRGRTGAVTLAAGVLLLSSMPARAAAAAKVFADREVTVAVEDELRSERGVSPNDLDIETTQGIVTLTGPVRNLLAKERAVQIAESLRGVRGVIDRTVVSPVVRPDEEIRKDILSALLQDPATEADQIAVAVKGAVVTLSGSVGSFPARRSAGRVAERVKGTQDVHNAITINYLAKRTDAEIAADVKSRLQWDIWTNGNLINAAVKDATVTLTGVAGSEIARSRAVEDSSVNGVMSIEYPGLKVEPWAENEARRKFKYIVKSDADVRDAVQAALRLDPRLATSAPSVAAEGAGIILGGNVSDLAAKYAAEQDARNTVGVARVDNLLKVRPGVRPSDAEMEKQLKAALAWDPSQDASKLDVAVINGVAYVSGAVDGWFEKADAQSVASRIKGVTEVRNHLKVEPEYSVDYSEWPYGAYWHGPYYTSQDNLWERFGPEPLPSDAQIKKSIEDSFFWSPLVDRADVTVAVHGGVATLTGAVGSRRGWSEADHDARKNAADVINHVTVRPGAWW